MILLVRFARQNPGSGCTVLPPGQAADAGQGRQMLELSKL
jgi:hypothetical protein